MRMDIGGGDENGHRRGEMRMDIGGGDENGHRRGRWEWT